MISYEQRTKEGLFLIMCLMSHHRSARSRGFSRAWHLLFALSQFMQQTRLSRRLFTVPYFFVRSSRCSAFYVPRGAGVWDYSSRGGGGKNRGEANMLSTSIRKMFHQWMFAEFSLLLLFFFFGGMAQKLNKITALKGDVCQQAISMLNVPGIFFIAFSSRRSYGKIEDC